MDPFVWHGMATGSVHELDELGLCGCMVGTVSLCGCVVDSGGGSGMLIVDASGIFQRFVPASQKP